MTMTMPNWSARCGRCGSRDDRNPAGPRTAGGASSRWILSRPSPGLVQDELDRRRSRLLDRRFALSGLTERKDLKDFDWSYNPKNPQARHPRACDSQVHRSARGRAVHRITGSRKESYRQGPRAAGRATRLHGVLSRGARPVEEINQARELGELRKYRATIKTADLVVIDDLFLRKLPSNAGDELADVIMSRYEKSSTLITSNRSRRLGKALGRCRHRHAAARSADAPRSLDRKRLGNHTLS